MQLAGIYWFKVKNKDTRTSLNRDLTHSSGISIVDFAQVNTGLEVVHFCMLKS